MKSQIGALVIELQQCWALPLTLTPSFAIGCKTIASQEKKKNSFLIQRHQNDIYVLFAGESTNKKGEKQRLSDISVLNNQYCFFFSFIHKHWSGR